MVKRPGQWLWSGHGEYLGKAKRGLIDAGPVMGELGTAARYEAFVREGARESYRAEWHPGDHAPFLGSQCFVRKMVKEKEPPPVGRRVSLGHLLKTIASEARLDSQSFKRKGRTARMVAARDRFNLPGGRGRRLSCFRGRQLSRMSPIECEPGVAERFDELVKLGKSDARCQQLSKNVRKATRQQRRGKTSKSGKSKQLQKSPPPVEEPFADTPSLS